MLRTKPRMLHWQTDGDLAGLREPNARDTLSPDERKDCLALWKEVAAVLRRAQEWIMGRSGRMDHSAPWLCSDPLLGRAITSFLPIPSPTHSSHLEKARESRP